MSDKPTTVGEMITRLRNFDPNLDLKVVSPEGLLMSGDLTVNEVYVNGYGKSVCIHGTNWRLKPTKK